MNINLEQIDTLRERANISYIDAKKALEECNGDMVEALIYVEKNNKIKPNEKSKGKSSGVNSFFKSLGRLIDKGNKMKFIIRKKETNILNIPVTLAIIVGVLAMPISLFLLIFALFTNHRIKIENRDGENPSINEVFDKMSSSVNIVKEEFKSEKADVNLNKDN